MEEDAREEREKWLEDNLTDIYKKREKWNVLAEIMPTMPSEIKELTRCVTSKSPQNNADKQR